MQKIKCLFFYQSNFNYVFSIQLGSLICYYILYTFNWWSYWIMPSYSFSQNSISFVTRCNKYNTDLWKKRFCGSYTRSYQAIILSIILLLFGHFICQFINRIWTGSGLILYFYIYCSKYEPYCITWWLQKNVMWIS